VGIYGPALRTTDGMKIILGGWGGGRGQYKQLNDTYIDGSPGAAAAVPVMAMMGTATTFLAELALLAAAAHPFELCELNVTKGKCCPGGSFMSVQHVNETATCCALCAKHKGQGCTSFTMNHGKSVCYLKNQALSSYSGQCDCGHTGPLPSGHYPPGPPSPPHNSSKILLYNVEEDSAEMSEMSAQHADVVAKLHALVVQHEKTGVPQATANQSCLGKATPSQDNSTAGQGRKYWGPWC
jgi:hypothetical protein